MHHVLRKNNPENIKGLVLLAPGIKENTALGFAAQFVARIGDINPKTGWLDIHPDEDKVKYESFCANAGAQFHSLAQSMRYLADEKPDITIPTFMAISSADSTVDPDLAREFFCKEMENKNNRLNWYTANGDPKKTCPGLFVKRIKNLEAGILDYAHLSLPMSPDNDYYGRNGEYKSCLVYSKSNNAEEQDDPNLKICREGEIGKNRLMYGEHIKENRKNYVIRRLTFNPSFDEMAEEIFEFIDRIETR